jgi:hypothetical protein
VSAASTAEYGVLFHVDMRWCEEGVADYSDSAALGTYKTNTNIFFSDDAGVTRNFSWSSSFSELTADGRCFRMRGDTSKPLVPADMPSFKILYFLWLPPSNVTMSAARRRFLPVQPSQVAVELRRLDGEQTLDIDIGRFFFSADTTPPVILHVPDDIVVTANPRTDRASAVWDAPQASDNVGLLSFYSNFQPGDNFTIKGSPHTVTYTAVDTSGLRTERSFLVRVTYNPVVFEIRQTLTSNSNISSVVTDALGTFVARHYFVRPKHNSLWDAIVVPTHNSTWTALDLVIDSPPGLALAQIVRSGLRARVVVNLEFTLNGTVVPADSTSLVSCGS